MSETLYALQFVTELPAGVRIVDPNTLDFSKNPVGALAFRYRHGWHLVNPLIPSRGMSGGGLARQHGHLSGGFTTGRFHMGANGKAVFKAEKRYASQADWHKEISQAASATGAAQATAHAAATVAKDATAKADNLAKTGGATAKQAEAHAVAATEHLKAAEAFKKLGTGGNHPGVQFHTATSAVHGVKAKSLGSQAKQEAVQAEKAKLEAAAKAEAAKQLAAAKAEAAKAEAAAKNLTADALTKSKHAQSLMGVGNHGAPQYASQVTAHKAAADAHKAAAAAHLAAGNHDMAAQHQKNVGVYTDHATHAQANVAMAKQKHAQYSGAAAKTEGQIAQEPSAAMKGSLHASAASDHQHAAQWASAAGNTEQSAVHRKALEGHLAASQQMKEQHLAEQAAAKAEKRKALAGDLTAKADSLSGKLKMVAGPYSGDHEKSVKHDEAAQRHLAAQQAHALAGNSAAAQHHGQMAEGHQKSAAQYKAVHEETMAKQKAKAEKAAAEKAAAVETSKGAFGQSDKAIGSSDAKAHESAAKAHLAAAQARFQTGSEGAAQTHYAQAEKHAASGAAITKRQTLAGDLTTKANSLSASVKQADNSGSHSLMDSHAQHTQAASAHLAAQKANELAGNSFTAQAHATAGAKHEKIAANKLSSQKTLENAANTASSNAGVSSTKAADAGKQNLPLHDKLVAHQAAADAHAQAATAQGNIGNTSGAAGHKNIQGYHEKQVADLKQAQADQAAAKNQAIAKGKQAENASIKAGSLGNTPEAVKAHNAAFEAHLKAKNAALLAGEHGAAQDHHDNAAAHLQASTDVQKHLKAQAAVQAAQDHYDSLGTKAMNASNGVASGGTPQEIINKHLSASDAHVAAADAATYAGLPKQVQQHKEYAKLHQADAQKLQTQLDNAATNKAAENHYDAMGAKAYSATGHVENAKSTKELVDNHLAAGSAHLDAAVAAQQAGMTGQVENHKLAAKNHLADAKKIGEANSKAGDSFNAGDAALSIGSKNMAVKHYQAAAQHADQAGNLPLKSGALSAVANLTGTQADHQAAGIAAAHALTKAPQSQKYSDLIKHHGDAADAAAGKAASAVPVPPVAADATAADNEVAKASQAVITSTALGAQAQADAHYAAAKAHQKAAGFAKSAGLKKEAKSHEDQAQGHIASGNHKQAEANLKQKMAQEKANKQAKADTVASGDKPLKPVGKLTGTGDIKGTHGAEVKVDEAGNKWLNKTDNTGYARSLDPAIAALQRKAGLPTPVFVKTKEGHLQGMVPGSSDAFKNGNFNPEKLSQSDLTKMLQHQVLDYATGNQDTHSAQWLQTPEHGLMQIDQGQAFKYGVGKGKFGNGKGDPTTTHPPAGADIPVYPKLWNAAKAGKVQIPDPSGNNAFADTIKSVQNMPDAQFKALFTPYAKQVIANGGKPGGHSTVDGFLNDIAAHKNNLGSDFQKLYDQLPASAKAGTTAAHAAETAKADALKAVKENAAAGKPLNSDLLQKAKDAGASLSEINGAHQGGKGTPLTPAAAAPHVLSPKEAALKAYAEHESSANSTKWEPEQSNALKQEAKAAGATPAETLFAQDNPETYLSTLPAGAVPPSAPSAPSAPSGPKIDPFKPTGTWKKATHTVTTGTGTQEVASVKGQKGMHVHKAVNGKGWVVSSQDGKALGGPHKTQKEAKLASEWIAKNHGATGPITTDSHKAWMASDPGAYGKFNSGVVGKQWNKDAQAKLDAMHNNLTAPGTPAVTAPSTPAPLIAFTGLGGDKKANATMMKELYDQAHGANPPAGAMAEYEKAQKEWTSHHSTGPFDPTKFSTPSSSTGSGPGADMSAKTKNWFPTSYAAGFVAVSNSVSANGNWKPTPQQAMGPKAFTSNAGYEGMGDQLRGKKIWGTSPRSKQHTVIGTEPAIGPTGGQWDKQIQSCNEAFAVIPPLEMDMVVSRKFDGYLPFDDAPPYMEPGRDYKDMGYNSTSKSADTWHGSTHLEIQIPKGRKVMDLNHTSGSHYPNEQEILINRESTYRIISDTKVGGTRKIVVMLMDDGVTA